MHQCHDNYALLLWLRLSNFQIKIWAKVLTFYNVAAGLFAQGPDFYSTCTRASAPPRCVNFPGPRFTMSIISWEGIKLDITNNINNDHRCSLWCVHSGFMKLLLGVNKYYQLTFTMFIFTLRALIIELIENGITMRKY